MILQSPREFARPAARGPRARRPLDANLASLRACYEWDYGHESAGLEQWGKGGRIL
jgi:hypothetical protein